MCSSLRITVSTHPRVLPRSHELPRHLYIASHPTSGAPTYSGDCLTRDAAACRVRHFEEGIREPEVHSLAFLLAPPPEPPGALRFAPADAPFGFLAACATSKQPRL